MFLFSQYARGERQANGTVAPCALHRASVRVTWKRDSRAQHGVKADRQHYISIQRGCAARCIHGVRFGAASVHSVSTTSAVSSSIAAPSQC